MAKEDRNFLTRLADLFRADEDAGPLNDPRHPQGEWFRVSRKGRRGFLIANNATEYAFALMKQADAWRVSEPFTVNGEAVGTVWFTTSERQWKGVADMLDYRDVLSPVSGATPDGATRSVLGARLYLAHDALPPGFSRVNDKVIVAGPRQEATPEQVSLFRERDNVAKARAAYRYHYRVSVSDEGDITMPAHDNAAVARVVAKMGGTTKAGRTLIPGEKVRSGEFKPNNFIDCVRRVERDAEREASRERQARFAAIGVDVSDDPSWVSRAEKTGDVSFRVAARAKGLIKAMEKAGAFVSFPRGGDAVITLTPDRFKAVAPLVPWIGAEIKRANQYATGHSETDVAKRLEGVTQRARSSAGASAPAGLDLLDPMNPLSVLHPLSPLNPATAMYAQAPGAADPFPAEPERGSSSGGYSSRFADDHSGGSSYSSYESSSSSSSYDSSSSSSSSYDSGSSSSYSSD